MAVLTPGTPFSASQPTLRVENQLDPGDHTFRLVVVDDMNTESDPVDLVVTVSPPPPPPAPDLWNSWKRSLCAAPLRRLCRSALRLCALSKEAGCWGWDWV